jgi:hypothetical protein
MWLFVRRVLSVNLDENRETQRERECVGTDYGMYNGVANQCVSVYSRR